MQLRLTLTQTTHKFTHVWRSALMLALVLSTITGTSLAAVQSAPVDLDTTFAGFRSQGFLYSPSLGIISDIALQPDGKVVVVGSTATANQLAVERYLPNGRLDPTFDGDGKAFFSNRFRAVAVALQPDGKIVVGGTRDNDFQLARLTSSGALDPSFDDDGWAQDFDPQLSQLKAILVQPDGKIVACGGATVGSDDDFGVTRYTPGGARDTTFGGGDGKVTIHFNDDEWCEDLALQSDGKLVAVGFSSNNDFAVARLEVDGTLDDNSNGDGGFGSGGKLTTGFGGDEVAQAVAIQPDGKIVVLGTYTNSSYIARYLPSGALDGAFGTGGKLTIPTDHLTDLALQPDGKLLALGYHESPDGGRKFALHRLLSNGDHDVTFDFDGIVWLDFVGKDEGKALALQPDGRILVAGIAINVAPLARLWPDGSFDTGGQQTHSLTFAPSYQPGYWEAVRDMALQPDGSFIVAGQVQNPELTRGDAFMTRFQANGLPDLSFGTNGSAFIFGPGVYGAANAVAVQPDGKIVIAGYTAYNAQYTVMDFMVARFLPNGGIDFNFGTGGVTHVDFVGGADAATALALTPDGKIVVAGPIQGSRYVWGVARLTDSGQLDPDFNQGGWTSVDFNGGNGLSAVVVQPDRKIILSGYFNGDFALQRLLENGQPDPSFGPTGTGLTLTDLGGTDVINALALAPNGWLYAAGTRVKNNNVDIALAQYTPQGILATCEEATNCPHWPTGTFFVDQGINDYAYALDLRADNQLVAAGCINQHFAAVQVRTDGEPTPLPFNTDFVGYPDCARAVKFSGQNQIVLAGDQNPYPFISNDSNIALARFETTPTPATYRVFIPLVRR